MSRNTQLILLVSFFSMLAAFSYENVSEVRDNFDEKSNSELTAQMSAFQRASLVYMAYASYFDRSDVSLPGFRTFFLAASEAAQNDSQKILDYINLRGGHQQFPILYVSTACKDMKVPEELIGDIPDHSPKICHFVLDPLKKMPKKKDKLSDKDWQHGLMGLTDALLLERSLNRQLLSLTKAAGNRGDHHLRHTMENFLTQQTERIKKLGDLMTKLRQYPESDYSLGEYLLDLEISW